MSTKVKAFIGVALSFVILIVLFTSNGGFRAARIAEQEAARKQECAVAENPLNNENSTTEQAK